MVPTQNDIEIEPSPRFEAFAYLEGRERTKRMAPERRRIPYQPKKERPIVQQTRERLEREFCLGSRSKILLWVDWFRSELSPSTSLKSIITTLSLS